MLRITAMDCHPSAANYLLRQTGCAEAKDARDREMENAAERGDAVAYYMAAQSDGATAPGRWSGAAARLLGMTTGSAATEDQVRALLGSLQHPETGEQLGAPPKTYASPAEKMKAWLDSHPRASAAERHEQYRRVQAAGSQTARGFYDFTFSAPKSVSLLHASLRALGEEEAASAVLTSHREAIEAAMTHGEEVACYVRRGKHTRVAGQSVGAFERGAGFAQVTFDHATSRAEEPQLHSHVAVANRTRAADGTWLAVHAAAFRQAKPVMSAIYESVMAELISDRVGVEFETREDGLAREVAGFTEADLAEFSSRRQQVVAQETTRVAEFERRYGRAPSPEELRSINRIAGRENRAAKSGRGAAEQLDAWAQAADPERYRAQWTEAAARVRARRRAERAEGEPPGLGEITREALAEVQSRAAVWTRGELIAAIAVRLVEQGGHRPEARTAMAAQLADDALRRGNEFGTCDLSRPDPIPVPGWWHDHRGEAIWRDPANGAHALTSHVSLEQRFVAECRRPGARHLSAERLVEMEAWLDGQDRTLSPDQRSVVLGILASDRAADVLVAPAGTGKSYTGQALRRAWTRAHGGRVLGIATSQAATEVLLADGMDALNSTQFLLKFDGAEGKAAGQCGLSDQDLLIVDEANMSSTTELARIQDVAARTGAKILFQGDPRQLAAVGAGGALALAYADNGGHTLERVHRFVEEWEREASLGLRDGDTSAIDRYEDRGRLIGGTREFVRDEAVQRWVADTHHGLRSVLVTATNEEATEVSALAQARLIGLGRVSTTTESPVALRDGNRVHAGDLIQARRNTTRDITSSDQRGVTNREFLKVKSVLRDGSLVCVRQQDRDDTRAQLTVTLPASYVAADVALGYAGTEHSVEGLSTDTCHALTPGYVAMTRGKQSNVLYAETERAGTAEEPRLSTTPRQVLAAEITRSVGAESAIAHWREEVAASRDLGGLLAVFGHVSAELGEDRMRDLVQHELGGDLMDRISMESDAGQNGLVSALRRAELDGHDVDQVLADAAGQRDFGGAHEVSRVLRARVERVLADRSPRTGGAHRASWMERAEQMPGALGGYHRELGELIDERARELGDQIVSAPPAWAAPMLGEVPEHPRQRDEWIVRAGRVAAYREAARVPEHATSLGHQPREEDVWLRAAYRDAAAAVGRSVDQLEYATRSDSDLRAEIARWERAQQWAPVYVAEEQAASHQAATTWQAEATVTAAEADAVEDATVAARMREAAERAGRIAARMVARTGVLDTAAEIWRRWEASTAAQRDAAAQATAELARRGLDSVASRAAAPEDSEQLAIFEVTTEFGAQEHSEQAAGTEPQALLGEELEREPVEVVGQLALFDRPHDAAAEADREAAALARRRLSVEPSSELHILGEREDVQTLADIRLRARMAQDWMQQRAERAAVDDAQQREQVALDEERQRSQQREQEAEAVQQTMF